MGRHKKVVMDQLTIDSTNAIKAGMTYGKYMAMKAQLSITHPLKSAEYDSDYRHICLNCKKEFIAKTRQPRKYCCDSCRDEYYYKMKSLEYPKIKACPICGNEFKALTFRNKYCKPFCSRVAQVRQQKTYYERKAEVAARVEE